MWLTRNRRDLMPSLTPSQEFVFDQGEEVGKLAQQLYPGGIDARPASPTNYQPALELTQQLIAEGRQVIYEAAFQFDGVLSALDILVKKEDGYYGYEIKSTTSIHDINITDAAMQYWVMKNCGVELKDISIIHINKEYEREGEIELQKLFKTESSILSSTSFTR
jgi:predicted RecB family nuclease